MMRSARGVVVVYVAGLGCGVGAAQAQVAGVYDFAYVPSQSGLTAAIDVGAQAGGTLIGDYDAVDNPAGTRTKPGLFGSFGATENVAVNVSNLGIGLGGNLNTDTTGGFRMAFDTDYRFMARVV